MLCSLCLSDNFYRYHIHYVVIMRRSRCTLHKELPAATDVPPDLLLYPYQFRISFNMPDQTSVAPSTGAHRLHDDALQLGPRKKAYNFFTS
jgi:hypothetical protein